MWSQVNFDHTSRKHLHTVRLHCSIVERARLSRRRASVRRLMRTARRTFCPVPLFLVGLRNFFRFNGSSIPSLSYILRRGSFLSSFVLLLLEGVPLPFNFLLRIYGALLYFIGFKITGSEVWHSFRAWLTYLLLRLLCLNYRFHLLDFLLFHKFRGFLMVLRHNPILNFQTIRTPFRSRPLRSLNVIHLVLLRFLKHGRVVNAGPCLILLHLMLPFSILNFLFNFPSFTHSGQGSHNIGVKDVLIYVWHNDSRVIYSGDKTGPVRQFVAPLMRRSFLLCADRVLEEAQRSGTRNFSLILYGLSMSAYHNSAVFCHFTAINRVYERLRRFPIRTYTEEVSIAQNVYPHCVDNVSQIITPHLICVWCNMTRYLGFILENVRENRIP